MMQRRTIYFLIMIGCGLILVSCSLAEGKVDYLSLAESGDAENQYNIGLQYEEGASVEGGKDYQKAAKWYRLAAEQGLAEAQYQLGYLFYNGNGVTQDYKKAAIWWQRAAEQGLLNAQYNLATLYSLGHGVTKDYVRAHMWANLAAIQGAKNQAGVTAADKRDSIAKKMSSEQIAEAQRLAREWKKEEIVLEDLWQIWIKTTPSKAGVETTWQPKEKWPTKRDCESSLEAMVQEIGSSVNRGELEFAVPGETTILPNGRGLISLFKSPTLETFSMAMEFFCFPDSFDPRPGKSLQQLQETLTTAFGEEDKVNHVDILMEYDLVSRSGRAALVWEPFESHPLLSEVDAKIAMAVMVYARLLSSHEETRSELFNRVTDIAEELIMTGKFHTLDWNLTIQGFKFTLWPWTLHTATELKNPRVYKATLIQTPLTQTTGGLIDMGLGQERVLAPSAPLILIKVLSEELDSKDNYKLGRALLEANIQFGTPENALPTNDNLVTDAVVRKILNLTENNPSVQLLGKEDAIQMFKMNLDAWNKNVSILSKAGTVSVDKEEAEIFSEKIPDFDSYMLLYKYPPSPFLPNGGITSIHPLYLKSKDKPTEILLRMTLPDESCLKMVARSFDIDIKKEMAPEFSVITKFKQEEFYKEKFVCVATYHIQVAP